MIPAVEQIQNRINEIQSTFDKLGFNKVEEFKAPSKPFSEYLNEASKTQETSKLTESQNTNNSFDIQTILADNTQNNVFENMTKSNAQKLNDILVNAYTVDMLDNDSKLYSVSNDNRLESYREKSENFPTKYDEIIKEASDKYSVPEPLIKALIKQESNYNSEAVSHKGAVGLMQLMPATAAELGTSEDKLTDPYSNIMTGTKYLSEMLNRYDGRIDLGLSAYNAGPTLVDKVNRIPNIDETQNYVKTIINYLR
jgi:soluble lytic murein transglycosylase-like protein